MTRAKRTDANQADIVAGLRRAGASVLDLSGVGGGAGDILVGFRGEDYQLEIKSEGGRLNKRQIKFHAEWKGRPINTCWTLEEALQVIGAIE